MTVLGIVAALFCLALGVALVRSGLRSWRHQVRYDKAPALANFDPEMKIGVERGLLPMGVAGLCVGALVGTVNDLNATHVMGSGHALHSRALAILLLVLLIATVSSCLIFMAISAIGRPRFLIPPHLRPKKSSNRRSHRVPV